MSEEVVDIIHRMTYEVQDSELQKAVQLVSKQISEVERLDQEMRKLSAEFAKTSAQEVQKREELLKKITANRNAVRELNESVQENIINNKELHKVLEREQGIIGSLNTRLDALKKKRDAATDPRSIQEYNRQIALINRQLSSSTTNQGARGGNAAPALMAASNIVRDAPFGPIGWVNNATQFTDNLAALNKQTGSTAASLKLLASSMLGPAGLAFGFSVVTSLITVLVMKYGSLGNAIDELFGSLTKAEKAQKALSEVMEDGNKEFEKATVTVNQLRNNIQLAKDGFIDKEKVVKEYNETIGKTTGAVKTLDEAEQQLARNADAYIRFTLLKAAANNALEEAAKKAFEGEMVRRKQEREFVTVGDRLLLPSAGAATPGFVPGIQQQAQQTAAAFRIAQGKARKEAALKDKKEEEDLYEGIARDLNKEAAELAKKYGFDFFTDLLKGGKDKSVENVYQQKLLDLKTRLASLTESVFQSDSTIRQKVAAEVAKGNEELDRLFKDKKLTSPQRDTLRALVGAIGDAQLEKELQEFNKKRIAAREKIDDELNKLILSESEQHAQLIRDDFDRQSRLIDLEAQKQREALEKARRELLQDNENKRQIGEIDPEKARKNADEIFVIYENLLTALSLQIARKRQDLSFTLFDRAAQFDRTGFAQEVQQETESVTKEISQLSESYVAGRISYEKYQNGITKIASDESSRRLNINQRELTVQLELLERKLAEARAAGLSDTDISALEERIAKLKEEISLLDRQIKEKEVDRKKKSRDERDEAIKRTIGLYTQLMNAGIQAAQAIAAAEEQSVARQIAAQERRVERATAIAERGNAKLLEQEEERLQKLQQEHERYARTQTALNALQTTSASLLAVANSAATGDPYSAAARVIAVIAALAAGFAAVKSLTSDSVAAFRDGQVDINGPGTRTSDSIPARISRGESVINADATAKNKAILEEINSGKQFTKVDQNRLAEVMARRPMPDLPIHNFQGISVVQQAQNQDYVKLLQEVRELRKAVEEKPSQSWSLDRRGFVAMYQDEIKFQDKMKKL